jgi:hypothetical protein
MEEIRRLDVEEIREFGIPSPVVGRKISIREEILALGPAY